MLEVTYYIAKLRVHAETYTSMVDTMPYMSKKPLQVNSSNTYTWANTSQKYFIIILKGLFI